MQTQGSRRARLLRPKVLGYFLVLPFSLGFLISLMDPDQVGAMLSIGQYFVASGCYVIFGTTFPSLGAPGFTKLLFEDVSLTVHAGKRLGLVGPNGCGKSSLFALLRGWRWRIARSGIPGQEELLTIVIRSCKTSPAAK